VIDESAFVECTTTEAIVGETAVTPVPTAVITPGPDTVT
jgi:hypothetical protein